MLLQVWRRPADRGFLRRNRRIPTLTSPVTELEALLGKLKADVKLLKKDRTAAEAAFEAAVEIRKKKAATAKTESINN